MKLNLGCGNIVKQGYINVDSVVDRPGITKKDIHTFLVALDDNSISEAILQDVLEHFPHGVRNKQCITAANILCVLYQKTQHNGLVLARVPDLGVLYDGVAHMKPDILVSAIFGGQKHAGDFHYSGWTMDGFKKLIQDAGFEVVSIEAKDRHDGFRNLNLVSKKP